MLASPILLPVGLLLAPSMRAPVNAAPRAGRPAVAQLTDLLRKATEPKNLAEVNSTGMVVPTFTSPWQDGTGPTQLSPAAATLNATVFRRAEFWDNRTATLLDLVNVLGRWESADEWKERTQFVEVDNRTARTEDEVNSLTLKRYQMAQRLGMVERVALRMNTPSLPFTNEKLAASVGMTVAEFEAVPVNPNACDVLFDALAQSRSGLIPPATIDQRRNGLFTAEGGFNEAQFRLDLYKARSLVIAAWFMFGKGNFVWVLVGAQFLHDARPDLFPTPKEMGLFKIGTFI